MTNLTSAGQFAGLSLITGGAPLFEMALTQFVVNIRYSLMSLSLSQKLSGSIRTIDRVFLSFFNTDEIFAVASMQEGTLGRRYLWGLALIPYLGWSGGTLIGAAAASLLPDRVASAFGIAIYGMFLAIIVPPAKHSRAVLGVVALSVAMSSLFQWLPALKGIFCRLRHHHLRGGSFRIGRVAAPCGAGGALAGGRGGVCAMKTGMLLAYIAVMAGVTYLIRMLPLTVFQKRSKTALSVLFFITSPMRCSAQ